MSAASSPARRLLPEGLQPESLVVGLSGLTVRAGVATAYALRLVPGMRAPLAEGA
jgi:hypothetical protein